MDLNRLRIRGLETAFHMALIREILSSVVPARLIDLTILLLFGLVTAKQSILNFGNERLGVHTNCWPYKEISNFCKLGEARQSLAQVSLSHLSVNAK